MSKSCGHNHGLDHCKLPNESRKHQYLNNSCLQSASGNSEKKSFTFLTKFQSNKFGIRASESSRCGNSFHKSILSREILIQKCIKLARIIKRTAVVCFSPPSVADDDYQAYRQLDKVTHALSREAFGPIYMVT